MSHIRVPVLAVAVCLLAGAFSRSALSQELFTQKVISMEMAQTMAQTAILQCRENGHRVSVTVLDNGGNIKVIIRDDGTSLATLDVSRRKAYSALIFRRTSGETAKAFGAMSPPPIIEGAIMLAGGVPIKVGTETIGAIGAPGGDKDEACASAGIAKIAEKLK